ncbi:AFG1-like ATPase (Lactation elevated protein 1), partial [Durusdinium trenchii]
ARRETGAWVRRRELAGRAGPRVRARERRRRRLGDAAPHGGHGWMGMVSVWVTRSGADAERSRADEEDALVHDVGSLSTDGRAGRMTDRLQRELEERKRQDKEAFEQLMRKGNPLDALQFPRKPKGLFVHGHVGTGKTVMMDMFYETLDIKSKRRAHLHEFMIDVHERIHRWKVQERAKPAEQPEDSPEQENAPEGAPPATRGRGRQGVAAESDGIAQVARDLAREHTLLAFDEFVITDVVDALILKHLFGVMFQEGTVVVATSNTRPDDLYKDGLNYHYFAPFIDMLKAHCKVFDMESSTDYRLSNGYEVLEDRYLWPLSAESKERFDNVFAKLTGDATPRAETVKVAFGRSVTARASVGGVCRFSFDELCGDREPVMGSSDFKALCERFDTIMVEDVPELSLANHNETRRFITLIDQMYDRRVDLVLRAAQPPQKLVSLGPEASPEPTGQDDGAAAIDDDLFSLKEMRVASKRLVSRLVEMTQ